MNILISGTAGYVGGGANFLLTKCAEMNLSMILDKFRIQVSRPIDYPENY